MTQRRQAMRPATRPTGDVLDADGSAVFTAFVEVGGRVPDEALNPPGYGPLPWRGALEQRLAVGLAAVAEAGDP